MNVREMNESKMTQTDVGSMFEKKKKLQNASTSPKLQRTPMMIDDLKNVKRRVHQSSSSLAIAMKRLKKHAH
jgi:hypothetical protein